VTIHGYLVWIALGYAAVSSVLAHLFGRRLHGLNVAQQRAEADYRATLLRVREHGESIAFIAGKRPRKCECSNVSWPSPETGAA
jgi:putative ATP-binding cassette transporter